MAEKLEDLLIWQRATELWDAVNAILDRPGLRKDWDLHDQIADALNSVVSNIAEGFEQPTDRAFARYLYIAKGSAAEVRAELLIATKRKYVEEAQFARCSGLSEEVQRMLGGFIKYLVRSDRRDRGTGKANVKVPARPRRRPPAARGNEQASD